MAEFDTKNGTAPIAWINLYNSFPDIKYEEINAVIKLINEELNEYQGKVFTEIRDDRSGWYWKVEFDTEADMLYFMMEWS